MDNFLTNIKVNKIHHLQDFTIHLDENKSKHLIITGKNGSGKTILLNAILKFLENIHRDDFRGYLEVTKGASVDVVLSFSDLDKFVKEYLAGNFVVAFYEAERQTKMSEPVSPVKPDMLSVRDLKPKESQFLNFLVDYKVQEALARNENQVEDAEAIREWFTDFTQLLRDIFEDPSLSLNFNYKDYSFRINSNGKSFKFTELSAGYSAVLDIVTDLILKMQSPDSLTRLYEKQGLVFIDEIETHLHLELQRLILPILTQIFPNIQFIVTTHSPFVLSSLPNVIAFDLEHKEAIEDLTDYSYEALAEGYFGVKTESSDIQLRLQRMEKLMHMEQVSESERIELEDLLRDFDRIPEAAAPSVKAAYYQLKLEWQNKKMEL